MSEQWAGLAVCAVLAVVLTVFRHWAQDRFRAEHTLAHSRINRIEKLALDSHEWAYCSQKQSERVYEERNACAIALALVASQKAGWSIGIRHDDTADVGWRTVLSIQMPTGQAAWHITDAEAKSLPPLPLAEYYDGHTSAEKYERLQRALDLIWRGA